MSSSSSSLYELQGCVIFFIRTIHEGIILAEQCNHAFKNRRTFQGYTLKTRPGLEPWWIPEAGVIIVSIIDLPTLPRAAEIQHVMACEFPPIVVGNDIRRWGIHTTDQLRKIYDSRATPEETKTAAMAA